MLRLRVMFVAVLALTVVAVAAIPSGAASSPSAKFCSAYTKISGGSDQPTPKQAKALAAKFKAAGKQAPGNVKSAANTHRGRAQQAGEHQLVEPSRSREVLHVGRLPEVRPGDRDLLQVRVRVRHPQLIVRERPAMHRLRVLLVAALALATLGVLAGPAAASVPAASNTSFCKPIKGISSELEGAGAERLEVRIGRVRQVRQGAALVGQARPGQGQEGCQHLGVVLRRAREW